MHLRYSQLIQHPPTMVRRSTLTLTRFNLRHNREDSSQAQFNSTKLSNINLRQTLLTIHNRRSRLAYFFIRPARSHKIVLHLNAYNSRHQVAIRRNIRRSRLARFQVLTLMSSGSIKQTRTRLSSTSYQRPNPISHRYMKAECHQRNNPSQHKTLLNISPSSRNLLLKSNRAKRTPLLAKLPQIHQGIPNSSLSPITTRTNSLRTRQGVNSRQQRHCLHLINSKTRNATLLLLLRRTGQSRTSVIRYQVKHLDVKVN